MSTPSSHRCKTCKSNKENARNLVVFIDGTSNKPGDEETSVVRLYGVVSDREGSEIQQRKLYLEGIGAYKADNDNPSSLGHLRRKISGNFQMTFACNVNENVKSAYSWLAGEYQEGDQVYLFGFSRGAYQVRALAAMIHEVGLVKITQQERGEQVDGPIDPNSESTKNQAHIDQACRNYRCINPNDPETRNSALEFKKKFCWSGLRIHFIGVWDTVSSLGLIKQDVHITASSSVTNACHFRHALALDERRVKFMPEYFLEVNAHHMGVGSPRSSDSDVKEVWFAGYHSDVGGTSRRCSGEDSPHAGNVPLLWMKQEAVANGLVFETSQFSWDPRDVDLGTVEEMNLFWRFVEALPIRHQVGFSGTGQHAQRWHLFRPRSVIPRQHLHPSILSGDVYTPRAALSAGVAIPTLPRITSGGLWAAEPLHEDAATLSSLLASIRGSQTAMRSLEKILLLLGSNKHIRTKVELQSSEEIISKEHHFNRFALAVIYDVASGFSMSKELAGQARDSLCAILSSPNPLRFPGIRDILQTSTRHQTLRQHFIADERVIGAFTLALDRITKDHSDDSFVLVMDCLCYLIDDDDQRNRVINQLFTRLDGLWSALEVKYPRRLMALLKVIASLGRYEPGLCDVWKPSIIKLAKKDRGPLGSAAVGALIELNGPLDRAIHFSNLLGYFDRALPRLDAEVGSTPQTENNSALFLVPPINGFQRLDEDLMHKLVQTIDSLYAQRRTIATLTLLKLCRYPAILDLCLQKNKVLSVFLKQMERKETSLLAAYALQMLLAFNTRTSDDLDVPRAAQLIVSMFDKGWFDDAVGQVEGSEIFRRLMSFDNLRQQVIQLDILTKIITKLGGGERHSARMSLICLDILGRQVTEDLKLFVSDNLAYLRYDRGKIQMKGTKVLSALALTKVGEEALSPYVVEIVKMLLPRGGQSPVPRSRLFGPAAALHNLCKNETLRKQIEGTPEYVRFKDLRQDRTLYPSPVPQKPDRIDESGEHPIKPGRQPRKRVRTGE